MDDTRRTYAPRVVSGPTRENTLVVDERILPDSGLPTEIVTGILDIAQEGSGLLRPSFAQSDRDIYISASQIRRFNLRVGDLVGEVNLLASFLCHGHVG